MTGREGKKGTEGMTYSIRGRRGTWGILGAMTSFKNLTRYCFHRGIIVKNMYT